VGRRPRRARKNSAVFLRSLEKYGKNFGHFPVWKNLKKVFSLLVWKRKKFSRLDIFWHTFSKYFIQDWYNCAYIVLNVAVFAFDLRRSYGNVRSGKNLEIYFQNCVETLTQCFQQSQIVLLAPYQDRNKQGPRCKCRGPTRSWKIWKKFLIFQSGKKFFSGLDRLTYIFITSYSRLILFYLYRVKYYSACTWHWVGHTEMLGLENVWKGLEKSGNLF